jgi:hypothetical protein
MQKEQARTVIVNFAEDGKLGCEFSCDFCIWKDALEAGKRIVPTNHQVRSFLRQFECVSTTVTINGGGDPLFNLDKNADDLIMIYDVIRSEGGIVRIGTKNIADISRASDMMPRARWKLSINELGMHDAIEDACRDMYPSVSCVIGKWTPPGFVSQYIKEYNDVVANIVFQGDFIHGAGDAGIEAETLAAVHRHVYYVGCATNDRVYLVGDEVRRGHIQIPGQYEVVAKF